MSEKLNTSLQIPKTRSPKQRTFQIAGPTTKLSLTLSCKRRQYTMFSKLETYARVIVNRFQCHGVLEIGNGHAAMGNIFRRFKCSFHAVSFRKQTNTRSYWKSVVFVISSKIYTLSFLLAQGGYTYNIS